jgi:bacteriocin biosynthesis cyclodehydratase domain-containing protein
MPWRDALIIEGGARRQLVRGTALASILPVLPRLVTVLEGRHSRTDICARFGLTPAVLDEFLASLSQCGVLERAGHGPSATTAQGSPQAACYLSRTAAAPDDSCRSGEEIASVLADSAVLVIAPSVVGKQIAADLTATGVGSVMIAGSASQVPAAGLQALAAAGQGVAAVLDDDLAESGDDCLAGCMARCHAYGIPVLRFAYGMDALEVGPTFHPGHPACAACFKRSYERVAWPAGAGEPASAVPRADEFAIQAVLTALVTSELLAQLGALGAPVSPRRLVRITVPGYKSEQRDLVPEPDCPGCGTGRSLDPVARTAATFERLEGSEPTRSARWLPVRAPSELRSAVPLLGTVTDMAWAPRIALDDERISRADPGIAEILSAFAGWRPAVKPGAAPRFEPGDQAPSATHAYLLADSDRTDLPATIYKYDGIARRLVGVRSDPVALTRALHATDLDSSVIGFAVVLVAAVAHMQYQHGSSALRLSHLDAGCAATQIAIAADACGRGISFASTWPPELGDLLELHPTEEVIATVAGIHRQPKERVSCR